ncbi:phytochromobilin:ferredoxin oxidoreductase, chloroplastic isoform X3 [Vigna unguiculata]|uniref:phytochromobilin:ferredoxin oxidoreductase, chloroplastic isoform X3 n=1 Tax=Vigna unguiculata TaxID=3917 RepID=UPI00101690B7|nr:phytochromobilin:ferredoxin oxidoreductase, chloroplastic isoform X3 [Vigna unguiculata]
MEFRIGGSSSSTFSLRRSLLPPLKTVTTFTREWGRRRRRSTCIQSLSVSYHKFVEFALDETRRHTHLTPSPLQDKFSSMNSKDGKGRLSMLSFEAAKIRLLRSLIIETETMQVFDFTVFPEAEYDVPIFCANFFTSAKTNIVVLDLNPLHDIINQHEYKDKYFKSLIPLGLKYTQDPGQGVLKKLIGDTLAKDLLKNFLFNGVDELGSKTFYDYFPHYCTQEGTLNKKGNIIGKSFENRPWDSRGEFIGE